MRILGFDLGDGESAVALLDEESTVEPRMMPILGKSSILSAVGMREGRIVVGDEASVLSGAQDAKVRFKSRYLTDPEAPGDVRAFAQGVMAHLLGQEPALMAQVSRTVVGCPAGWGEGRRQQYAALMESAGFPNVHVVPESRAAFLYARHARGLRVNPELMQHSAMVIDIGSSTTDFAYIIDGHQQDQALFGDTNLGGGLLDELILRRCVELSPDRDELQRVLKESPAWRSYCELEARRMKERYFLDEEKWQEQGLSTQLVVCYDMTLMLELRLDAQIIDEIIHAPVAALGGRSFVDAMEQSLSAARGVSSACPPQVVILTGGASRMAFFKEACRAAFEGSLLVLCPEPECSIARGLAYAGRVDERLKTFREEVASIARGERLNSLVSGSIHELYTPLARVMVDAARHEAMETIALWKRGGIGTIEELERVLSQRIEASVGSEAVRAQIAPVLQGWTDRLMDRMEGELTALCRRCGVPPERMSLRGTKVDTGMGRVKVSVLDAMGMDMFTGLLGVVMAAVGASLCGGGGIALLGSGPVGMAVGAVAGVLLAFLGKDGMEQAVRTMKVPVLMRQLVLDFTVESGLDRQRGEMERSIIASLADPSSGFSGRLCQSLASTLGTQMERMARGAEMSICA
ncbi:MAG: Hsp70 family protein [Clostridia bacterium]|nr:Hsp70 family protein [Clostridia bacterium]